MGKMIAYGIAVLFALCAFLVLALIVAADIAGTREYIRACRTMARVNGPAGESRTANYGLQQTPTKYYAYHVTYHVNNRTCSGIHLCRKDILKEGDAVEIRYTIRKDGTAEIVNRDIKDRFFRMLLCAAIAVPLCMIGIVYC